MPKSQPADRRDPNPGEDGPEARRQLIRYAGLATEMAVAVGFAVWLGIRLDKWSKLSFPIFSWGLPLLVIVVLLVQLIKANSRSKNEE